MQPIIVNVSANVAGFLAGMGMAQASAAKLAASLAAAGTKGSAGLTRVGSAGAKGAAGVKAAGAAAATSAAQMAAFGQKSEQHLNRAAKVSTGIGLALVGFGLIAAKSSSDFEKAMSNVAATGTEARVSLSALRIAALDAGKTTQYSAIQAAEGIEDMIKAGVSAKDVYGGGLTGALNLAAAGTLDVRKAAELAATAMAQFQLKGKDVPHIADLLAAGAGKAQGTVEQLGFALKYVGPVANGMNVSIEETVGTLAELANVGILGEQAGTSLRGVLLALTSPSKVAAAEMKKLGIEMYDSKGRFIGLSGAAEQLHTKMRKLTNAERDYSFGRIFGNAQITAARTLYEGGGAAVDEWTAKVTDSGFAADAARIRLDNLRGDLTKLGNQFKTALIGAGSGSQAPLRDLTQGITGVVAAFNNLDSATQSGVVDIALKIGGIALAAGAITKTIAVLGGFRKTLVGIGAAGANITKGGAALRAFGVAGLIAAGAMIAIQGAGTWINSLSGAIPKVDELAKTLKGMSENTAGAGKAFDDVFAGINQKANLAPVTQQITDFSSALEVVQSQGTVGGGGGFAAKGFQQAQSILETLGFGKGTVTQFNDRVKEVDGGLALLRATGQQTAQEGAFRLIAAQMSSAGMTAQEIIEAFPQVREQLVQQAEALDVNNIAWEDMVKWAGGEAPAAINKATAASVAGTKAAIDQEAAFAQTEQSLEALSAGSARTAESSDQLAKSLFATGDAVQNTISAHSGFAAAIDNADKAITKENLNLSKNHKRLSDNSQAQRDNIASLNDLATSGKGWVQSLIQQGAGAKQAAAATQKVRDAFVDAGKQAGLTGGEARALADQYGLIPKEVNTKINAFIDAMQQVQVNDFLTSLAALPPEQATRIKGIYEDQGAKAALQALEEVKDKEVIVKAKGEMKGVTQIKDTLATLKDRYVRAVARGDDKGAKKIKAVMDGLKDKQVIARSKGVNGAKDVEKTMKALKDRYVKAVARGDKKGATAVKSAMDALKNKSVTATAKPAGVGATQGAINSIHGKTVTVTVVTNHVNKGRQAAGKGFQPHTGGLIVGGPGGFDVIRRGRGGPVWGAGTATSDSIPAWLSNGEFVIRAAAVRAIGAAKLFQLNALGLAGGGLAAFKKGGKAESEASYEKEVTKVIRLQRDLEDAKSTKELIRVTKALEKANKKLNEGQQSLRDAITSMSTSLVEPYKSKSKDIDDWLEAMKNGTSDLTAFEDNVKKLRKLGLNETLIKQISEQGAVAGNELAEQIVQGGKGLADSLNLANKNLLDAAKDAGAATTVVKKYATGGPVHGGGTTTSDSILARLSRGEWVVPAAATERYRSLLESITYGGTSIAPQAAQSFARGGPVRHEPKEVRAGDVNFYNAQLGASPEVVVRKISARQRDSQIMAGLTVAV